MIGRPWAIRLSRDPTPSAAPAPSMAIASRRVTVMWRLSYFRVQSSELANLEQASRAHAAADAHRDDDTLDAAGLARDERVPDEPLAGHAVGMSDSDGAAVHVQAVLRNPEPIAAVDHL